MENQITIALTKGRIEKDTVKLLEKAGFDMTFMEIRDVILFLKAQIKNSVFCLSRHLM